MFGNLRNRGKSQRGNIVLMMVSATTLIGMGAFAIDQAMMWDVKQRAQNVADGAALSAGVALGSGGSTSTATSYANTVIANANSSSSFDFISKTSSGGSYTYVTFPTSVTCDDGTTHNFTPGYCARVDGYINAPVSFGRAIGWWPNAYDGTPGMVSVPAHAIVIQANISNATGVLPFGAVADYTGTADANLMYIHGLLTNPPAIGTYSPDIVLKSDQMSGSSISASGNFGAIDLPGSSGSNGVRDNLSTPNTGWVNVLQWIGDETGNMQGPVQQGIANRLASTNPNFTHRYADYDTWYFGLSADPTTGTHYTSYYVTMPDGSQHIAYNDPLKQQSTDAHLGIIPLITNPDKSGSGQVQILGFGVFFLDTSTSGGNQNVTSGHFIGEMVHGKAGWDTGGASGQGGGAYVLRLIQ